MPTAICLYCNAEKCQFRVWEVGFLAFVINSVNICVETDRISTIEDWPTPEAVQNVQVLLGFTNIYRSFIQKYAIVTAPILNLQKSQNSQQWEWTRDAEPAFWKPKKDFTIAQILQHLNPPTVINMQTDASVVTSQASITSEMESGFFFQAMWTFQNTLVPNTMVTHKIGSSWQ